MPRNALGTTKEAARGGGTAGGLACIAEEATGGATAGGAAPRHGIGAPIAFKVGSTSFFLQPPLGIIKVSMRIDLQLSKARQGLANK